MAYINLTPHEVSVYVPSAFEGLAKEKGAFMADSVYSEQAIAVFPKPENGPARIATQVQEMDQLPGNIPCAQTVYGDAIGIPEDVQPEDILIVSLPMQAMARQAGHPLASQMVAPFDVVRERRSDDKYVVLGCMGFTY